MSKVHRHDCEGFAIRSLGVCVAKGMYMQMSHEKLSVSCHSRARIAQSAEHQTFNLRVRGSSPCSGEGCSNRVAAWVEAGQIGLSYVPDFEETMEGARVQRSSPCVSCVFKPQSVTCGTQPLSPLHARL